MVITHTAVTRIALLSLAALIGIGIFLHMGGEHRQIRRQFDRLSEAIDVAPGEGLLAQGLKSNRLGELFAAEATLTIPGHSLGGDYSRTEIARKALAARNQCERLALDFYDIEIEPLTSTEATVRTTARLKGRTHGGETFNEVRELVCRLVKEEGQWRFRTCTVESILSR